MDPLATLFANLDRWRNLPAYQLERRADIFFSVYLPSIVQEVTGVELSETVIPELPIKRDLIWPDMPSNKSFKVDYALFARDRSRLFLVELKTDTASRRESQDTYLERASEVGLARILRGLLEIVGASSAQQKYHHLLHAFAQLGCLELPPNLGEFVFPRARKGLRQVQSQIEVTVRDDEFAIEVIYVQPTAADHDRCIDFGAFADHVAKLDDAVSQTFARYLRGWTRPAGSMPPDA